MRTSTSCVRSGDPCNWGKYTINSTSPRKQAGQVQVQKLMNSQVVAARPDDLYNVKAAVPQAELENN